MKKIILSVFAFLLFAGISNAIDIAACSATLGTAGATYVLTTSIVNTTTCFTITAANITLDCAGYNITGDNGAADYGVYSNQLNTTIKNCNISYFGTGIYLNGESTDFANITNNTIYGTFATSCADTTGRCAGIYLVTTDYATINSNDINIVTGGIVLYNAATYNNITYNNITASGSIGKTIQLTTGASNNIVSFNNVTDTAGDTGIGITTTITTEPYFSNNNLISYNNVSVNDLGITTSQESKNNNISYNNITSPGGYSISISGGVNTTVQYNKILSGYLSIYSSDVNSDFSYNNITETADTAVNFQGAINNTFQYNNISTAGTTAIYLTSASENISISYNNISATTNVIYLDGGSFDSNISYNKINATSAGSGIYIDSSTSPCTGNLFFQNNISATIWVQDFGAGSANNYNNSQYGNIYYFKNGTGTFDVYDIYSTGGTTWANAGIGRPFNATTLEGNWSTLGTDWRPYTPYTTARIQCGKIVIPNYVHNLTSSIPNTPFIPSLPNQKTCFNITGENITLNCASYNITGNQTAINYGVYSNTLNTTIKNCNISNFSISIWIQGTTADYANITNNTINSSWATSCSVTTGQCNGIHIANADNASITGNRISVNTGGISLNSTASDAFISSNNISTVAAYGIALSTNSITSNISYNIINTATTYPIYLSTATGSIISYNNVTATTSQGIYLTASSNNNFSFNNANGTVDEAITLVAKSMNNTITNNSIKSAKEATNISLSCGNNTFLLNNITGTYWINDRNYSTATSTNFSTNNYNSTNTGNIYYWTNGTGAWQVFDISCTGTFPCWADAGTSIPFNNTNVGNNFSNRGQDWFPYTLNGLPPQTAFSIIKTTMLNYIWATVQANDIVCSGTPYSHAWQTYSAGSGRKIKKGNPYAWTWENE